MFEPIFLHLKNIWRFHGTLLLIAWLVAPVGIVFVYMMPDQYGASARVNIDTESLLRPLLAGMTVSENVHVQLEQVTRTILSRPNLEKVIRNTDLDITTETPEEYEGLLRGLARDIKFQRERGRANLYKIRYANADPVIAKKVVQAVMDIFIEGSLGEGREEADAAEAFLDKQIESYEKRLAIDEETLAEFKRNNIGMIPSESGGSYFSQLQAAKEALKNSQWALAEELTRYNRLKGQIAVAKPTIRLSISATNKQLNAAKEQLAALQLSFTDQHPDIVSLKRTIKELGSQKSLSSVGIEDNHIEEVNPVYQQLELMITESELKASMLERTIIRHTVRVEELLDRAETMPMIEAELKKLARDYGVTKSNYENLLSRREKAILSREADRNSDDLKVTVVDPPFVPSKPTGPKRFLFLLAVFGASLGVGVAIAFLRAELSRAYVSADELRQELGMPVIGSVTMVWSGVEKSKRHTRAGLLMLGVVLFGLMFAVVIFALPYRNDILSIL